MFSLDFDKYKSIPEAFFDCAKQNPDKILFSQALIIGDDKQVPRPNKSCTFAEAENQVRCLASYLTANGFMPGSRAAIISNSRPEWMVADLAVLAVGGVVASVYQSLTPSEVGYILFDADVHWLFIENQEQMAKIESLINNEFEVAATEDRAALKTKLKIKKIISFEEIQAHNLVESFKVATECKADTLDLENIKRGDLATLVYTSGTSGPPKGVMQTHGNHLSNLRQAFQAGMYNSDSSIVLFLPLAHSFARLMAYIGCIAGARLSFPATTDKKSSRLDQKSVTRDIAEANVTIIPLVPRLLEKMKLAVEQKASAPGIAGILLKKMLLSAQSRSIDGKFDSVNNLIWYYLTAPLRKKIRKVLFGKNFINAISGGAKLSEEINIFFDKLGITILQGYGLTETCVATNVNRLSNNKIGTVGPLLSDDIELKLADDGEIMFRGPNVALGYLNREKATKEAWDNQGWFKTGDVGELDSQGRLSITGRKKELIVTAGGKKIAPDAIEARIKSNSLFSQVVLVGEGKPYCCLIVTLNAASLIDLAKNRGLEVAEPYSKDGVACKIVSEALSDINKDLASFESIKKFMLLDSDFTVENSLLTPTFKVKRTLVIKNHAQDIEAMYANKHGIAVGIVSGVD